MRFTMKRANGEGSVFKLKDGSWRAACVGGKPSFRGDTRAEAIRRREVYLRKHRHVMALPRAARGSFAAVITAWLDYKRDSLAPRTIESYTETAERYIVPTIGTVAVGKIGSADVLKAMAKAPSPRTKNYVRSVCHMAIEYAVDEEMIPRNLVRKVPKARLPERVKDMPTLEQWSALVEAINREATGTRGMLLVMANGGLRIGEVAGLRWPDLSAGGVRVVRQLTRGGTLEPVKSAAGRRTVPLPDSTLAVLEAWRSEQAELRSTHAKRWKKAPYPDLIFTTRYGTPWGERNILRAAYRVTEAAGMGRHGAHHLRHVAISRLVAAGVDVKTVQQIAGHSSIRVTLDTYGHLIPGSLDRAAEAMNRQDR
jgi:integrase